MLEHLFRVAQAEIGLLAGRHGLLQLAGLLPGRAQSFAPVACLAGARFEFLLEPGASFAGQAQSLFANTLAVDLKKAE